MPTSDFDHSERGLVKLKTGRLERRWSLAKVSLLAGARHIGRSASVWWLPAAQRRMHGQDSFTREAIFFIEELSKLKGSIVKVGQMMAVWGDTFFPLAVVKALHSLENQTVMMDWPSIHKQLTHELGSAKLREFSVTPTPLGCASLAQVHRATRLIDNGQWCFKVQYPGIAESIESDMASLTQLLHVTRLVPRTREFEQWITAIKVILKQEVDYHQELEATLRFQKYLANQTEYRVPDCYPEYSTSRVLACSYEEGVSLNCEQVLQLSQNRRDRLGAMCLHLFWREIFQWGEMQTDPNFGNYLVRINSKNAEDVLILLDFGAVYRFDPVVLKVGHGLIRSLFHNDQVGFTRSLFELKFLEKPTPDAVVADLYQLMQLAMEPFCTDQIYDWSTANLLARIIDQIKQSAFSQHFKVPPKDLLFVSRKIIGAFSLLATLGSRINGHALLRDYLIN